MKFMMISNQITRDEIDFVRLLIEINPSSNWDLNSEKESTTNLEFSWDFLWKRKLYSENLFVENILISTLEAETFFISFKTFYNGI